MQHPWGESTFLAVGSDYVIKQLTLNPHSRTSLQYHHYRNEHWVCLEGLGMIEVGDTDQVQSRRFEPWQFVVVNSMQTHRITNHGDMPLVVLEAQYGRCEETDIERLVDDYGRV